LSSKFSARPWLITGAAGFLGSHVVEHLVARDLPVVALDNLSWGRPEHLEAFKARPNFRFAHADIRDADAMRRTLKEYQPCVLIHLAALHYIPAAVADPALTVSVNVHGTQVVVSAAIEARVERFWFASTGDVYAPSETPHREDDRLAPFNIYGLSKVQGEQLIQLAAREQPQTHFVIGRLFNLYGPRETNPHIVPEIVKQLREHPMAALRLGNLWPKRELIPISEAARVIIESTLQAPSGVTTVNVASGAAWSMQEVIDLLGELLGRKIEVETDPARVRPTERAHLQADVTQLRELLGWTPHHDLRRGLTDLLTVEGML